MSTKKIKCPYCEKRYERKELCDHIDRKHDDLLPENYTGTRLVFDKVNNNTKGYGVCRICGRPTEWNEKIGRYNQLCGRESCKKAIHERYRKNMIKVYGEEYSLLNDPEQQKKMLANRSISGEYRFQDGGKVGYTGSYEKKCLEFMDKVMEINSEDIMSPGPTMEYEYNGEKHMYIPDFLYIPYNLIIEVKDGGSNPNTQISTSREDSKARTIAKEKIFTSDGEYSYLRLTNNDFVQLISIFMDMKYKILIDDNTRTIRINESYISEGLIFKTPQEASRVFIKRFNKKVSSMNSINDLISFSNLKYICQYREMLTSCYLFKGNYMIIKITCLYGIDYITYIELSFKIDENNNIKLDNVLFNPIKIYDKFINKTYINLIKLDKNNFSYVIDVNDNKSKLLFNNPNEKACKYIDNLKYDKSKYNISYSKDYKIIYMENIINESYISENIFNKKYSMDEINDLADKCREYIKSYVYNTEYLSMEYSNKKHTTSDNISKGIMNITIAKFNIDKCIKSIGNPPKDKSTISAEDRQNKIFKDLKQILRSKPEFKPFKLSYSFTNTNTGFGSRCFDLLYNNSIINESLIYGKDKNIPFKSKYIEPGDLFINLEKWQSNENNVLFITGVSGTGKTTLAIDLAKEVACQRVELDYVAAYYIKKYTENGRGKEKYDNLKVEAPDAVEFLDLNPPESLGYCDKFSDTMTIQDMFIKWFISKVYGNGKLYIVNGAVFVYDEYYDLISNSPCIFKEVNWFKTAYRRTVREFQPDKSFFDNYKSMYKALKTAFKPGYIKANIDAISIRNNIKKYNESYIGENKVFSTKNLEYNMNKWPNQSNILFITGLSGSGKSTLAAEEAKKYNAVNIELDLLEFNDIIFDKHTTNDEGNLIIKDYMDKYYNGAHKFKTKGNGKDWNKEVNRFLKYCIDIAKNNKDKKYIIEGIQLIDVPDSIDVIKSYPIIVVNTSMIKSMWRAYKREECSFLEYMKSFKSISALKEYINFYLSMEKDKNEFIKNLKEQNVFNESTNKILYHGSHENITNGYILPQNNSYEDDYYVFGTSDRNFALCYAGKPWHDGIINQGYLNDELFLSEVKENAFEDIFNTDGYIYEIVWDDNFYNRGMKTEYLSKEKAKIISKTYIKNVFDEIKKRIKLYYYNDKAPKYIEDKRKSFREEQNAFNESRTNISEKFYKIRYDGSDIYEALMVRLPGNMAFKITNNPNTSWLAKYRELPAFQDIYYTSRGISEFNKVALPTINQLSAYIDLSKITIEEYKINANIVQYNPFYIIVSDIRDYTITESYCIESFGRNFYRITYNDTGIYQAFKNNVNNNIWFDFIKSPEYKWLPKLDKYLNGYESYFTEFGYKIFMEKTYPIFAKYLDEDLIEINQYNELPYRVIYKDKYQIIVDNKIMESI